MKLIEYNGGAYSARVPLGVSNFDTYPMFTTNGGYSGSGSRGSYSVGGKKSTKYRRKHNKSRKHNLKGGNKQPFSNTPLSFSYGLGSTGGNSALANPMPFTSISNC